MELFILSFFITINIAVPIILFLQILDPKIALNFLNPIWIYKQIKVNWFGAYFIAFILNTLFPPYAIGYWVYKLCTVGRK